MKTLLSTLRASKETLKAQIEKTATMKGQDSWLFVPENRENKVCLVAHIDTVWDNSLGFGKFGSLFPKMPEKKAPEREKILIHDKEKGLIWSPDGLGADDRAGVYAALKLFKETPEPYKPFILLTDYEESGGKGAREAADIFAKELAGCNFFIELDRANGNDAVFYNGEPKEFADYISEFGFKESVGSFSDISIVCPSVQRCGVNLSIGYYNQHTDKEYLDTSKLFTTVEKVRRILKDNYDKKKVWDLEVLPCEDRDWIDRWGKLDDGDESYFEEDVVFCPECGDGMELEDLDLTQGYCVSCGNFIMTASGVLVER